MPVDALLLLVAVAVLLEEAAYRDFLFDVDMEVVALLAARASILDPVDADQLLTLSFVHFVAN